MFIAVKALSCNCPPPLIFLSLSATPETKQRFLDPLISLSLLGSNQLFFALFFALFFFLHIQPNLLSCLYLFQIQLELKKKKKRVKERNEGHERKATEEIEDY